MRLERIKIFEIKPERNAVIIDLDLGTTSIECKDVSKLSDLQDIANYSLKFIRKETSKTSDAAKSVDVDKRGS